MKVLKVIGIALLVLIGGYLVVAAVSDKEYAVTREIEVNIPVEKAYALAADFNFYK